MKRVGVFVDVNNLYSALGSTAKVDYFKYLERAGTDYLLVRATAYGAQKKNEAGDFIACLRHFGYHTNYLPATVFNGIPSIGQTYLNMTIAMDAMRMLDRVDVMIFGSNNPDMIPLYKYLKERGIEIIIFAAKLEDDVRMVADSVIEVSRSVLNIRSEEPECNSNGSPINSPV